MDKNFNFKIYIFNFLISRCLSLSDGDDHDDIWWWRWWWWWWRASCGFFPRALITWHHKQNQFFSEILDISEIAEWRVSIIPPYGRPQHSSGHAPRGHAFSWKSFYQLQQPLKTIPFLPFSLHLTLKQMGRGARRDWSA